MSERERERDTRDAHGVRNIPTETRAVTAFVRRETREFFCRRSSALLLTFVHVSTRVNPPLNQFPCRCMQRQMNARTLSLPVTSGPLLLSLSASGSCCYIYPLVCRQEAIVRQRKQSFPFLSLTSLTRCRQEERRTHARRSDRFPATFATCDTSFSRPFPSSHQRACVCDQCVTAVLVTSDAQLHTRVTR